MCVMAATLLIKSNPLLLSKRRQNYNANLHGPRSAAFSANSKFAIVKVQIFTNSTLSSNDSKNNITFPFNLSRSSISNQISALENDVFKSILSAFKLHVVLILQSLLLTMLLHGSDSALARTGGSMGGHSFSSSSKSTPASSSSTPSSSRSSYSSSSSSRSSSGISSNDLFSSPSKSSEEEEEYITAVASHPPGQQQPTPPHKYYYVVERVILFGIISFAIIMIAPPILSQAKAALDRILLRVSVAKLQVALLVTEPTLHRDLNRIAETADTSTSAGWIYILEETTVALLRHSKYWTSYYSSVDVKKSLEDAEACFKNLSIEERSNFDEETVVNYSNNVKKGYITQSEIDQFKYTYMVVTVLVAANGTHKLPTINNSEDLTKALQKLRSVHASGELQAVNVVWTPQEVSDVMSLEELNLCYPHLKPF